jgi:hypothetical protein
MELLDEKVKKNIDILETNANWEELDYPLLEFSKSVLRKQAKIDIVFTQKIICHLQNNRIPDAISMLKDWEFELQAII